MQSLTCIFNSNLSKKPPSLNYFWYYGVWILHTCLITYLFTCLRTYLLSYLLTYLLTYLLACILNYLLTYLRTCLLTYMITYLLTYLHTCLLTYMIIYLLNDNVLTSVLYYYNFSLYTKSHLYFKLRSI